MLDARFRESHSIVASRHQARLNWGVLCTSTVGRLAVIPAIQRSANGRVLAIASRELERANRAALEFEIQRAYGAYQQLIDDPDVDAVYIPLPNHLHREWTIRAAAAGKHVLCEKPLALSAAEAAEMIDACDRHGVLLMEAFMYRFHPRSIRVKKLVDGGAIGPIQLVRSAFAFLHRDPTDYRFKP